MINVKLEVKTKTEKPFPKLMRSATGSIVLFSEPREGILIYNTDQKSTMENGDFESNWEMSRFTDYNEPITIQNA